MANVKINDLAVIADPASTDVLPIVDVTLDTTNKISIADILKTVPAGTASAPSIAFEGDSNTGIYHPGSEQIGFTTSGSDAIRITSDGQVGIGTTDPGSKLSNSSTLATDGVQSAGSNSLNWQSSNTNAYIAAFENQSTGNGALVKVGDSNSSRKVLHALDGSNNSLLLVRGDGKVGIGKTDPEANLHINGSVNTELRIEDQGEYVSLLYNDNGSTISVGVLNADNGNTSVADTELRIGVDGAKRYVTKADGSHTFYQTNGSTESMRITSTGNVGIGTESPQVKFAVASQNTNTAETIAEFGNQTIAGGLQIETNGNLDWGFNARNSRNLTFSTNQAERLRIDSDGNVGIGTSDPEAKLSIVGTYTAGGIKIVDGSTTASSPGIEVIAKRGNANNSTCFSGKLLLSRNRTDAAIVANNQLGSVSFGGNHTDGTEANILYSAALIGVADGAFNDASDMPTALAFFTGSTGWSPDTANTSPGTERVRITSGGLVGIGLTNPGEKLEVNGTIKATDINFTGLATYADDAAAGAGGLVTGDVYKTSTGELRIKL